MKVFYNLLILFCFSVPVVKAQEYIVQKEITQKVINHFEGNESDQIYALFDNTMKSSITAEKLSEIWQSLSVQCGAYLGSGATIASEVNGMVVVNQLLDFANMDLDIRLAFNDENQISGLFFVPPVKKKSS